MFDFTRLNSVFLSFFSFIVRHYTVCFSSEVAMPPPSVSMVAPRAEQSWRKQQKE
ncbi:hypothetical protein LDENG_00239890, partial [Lucifuga dentata]